MWTAETASASTPSTNTLANALPDGTATLARTTLTNVPALIAATVTAWTASTATAATVTMIGTGLPAKSLQPQPPPPP